MIVHTLSICNYNAAPARLRLGTEGSYGVEYIQLKTDDRWAELTITATFTAPDGTPTDAVANTDGLIKVPHEATCHGSGCGAIVLRGCRDGVQVITCDVGYTVTAHGPVNGMQAAEPTPDKWQQFVDAVAGDRQAAEDAADRAKQAADDAEGHANSAAQSAQAAENDRKQADESAGKAADSADAAAKSAELARQVANKNGYAAMTIDDAGHLKLTRTTSLADKLDFAIVDDKNLEVRIYG